MAKKKYSRKASKGSKVGDRVLGVFRSIKVIQISDTDLLNTDYLDQGLVDSLEVVDLISRLEREFEISFLAEELESEKFRTLKGVVKIIESKL